MTYYILLPNDTEKDALPLGEESLGSFYLDEGMYVLNKIVSYTPHLIDKISIINEKNEKLTLTEFFDILSTLTIKKL